MLAIGRPRQRLRRAIALVAAAGALAGCATSTARRFPIQTRPSPKAHLNNGPAHIAVIVMENEAYGGVIGSRSAPYINALARRYALAQSMFALTHPSLPNYLALTGGSTFGIDSDCTDCSVTASSIVDQLTRARISWKAYMEDLPHPCFTGASSTDYAKKHDPFLYYAPVARNPARCRDVVPLSALATDERARTLPRFIWITPDLCHDMHDCDVATGDRFLSRLLPPLLSELGRQGLLILTWDEGSSDDGCCRLASGGHIVTIIAGPGARRRGRLLTPADHYSVLALIEDLLRLPRLRDAACACTPSLRSLLSPQ